MVNNIKMERIYSYVVHIHPAECEMISAEKHTNYRSEPAAGGSTCCCLDRGQKVTFITTCDAGHPQPIVSLAPRCSARDTANRPRAIVSEKFHSRDSGQTTIGAESVRSLPWLLYMRLHHIQITYCRMRYNRMTMICEFEEMPQVLMTTVPPRHFAGGTRKHPVQPFQQVCTITDPLSTRMLPKSTLYQISGYTHLSCSANFVIPPALSCGSAILYLTIKMS